MAELDRQIAELGKNFGPARPQNLLQLYQKNRSELGAQNRKKNTGPLGKLMIFFLQKAVSFMAGPCHRRLWSPFQPRCFRTPAR